MMKMVISCEHAGNDIPDDYKLCFADHHALLASHRGYDIGAKYIAQNLANRFSLPFFWQDTSRLLIEVNRSIGHPQLFSSISGSFGETEKNKIKEKYYWPYRKQVENHIEKEIEKHQQVLHLSIHSFTPVLNEVMRTADLGFLYDPARLQEKQLAVVWKYMLREMTDWRIRFNYPYLGKADGFTTYLRRRFGANYIGIEVEVNQALCTKELLDSTSKIISDSLDNVMHAY